MRSIKRQTDKDSLYDRLRGWASTHREIVRFFLVFVIVLAAFSFILERDAVQQAFVSPHLTHVALLCGKVLNGIGTSCDVYGSSITSSRFSVQVIKGCESIYATAMLWAALLAYPASWRWKLVGIVGGAVILFIVNILRVITMFYIGIYFPSLFDMVHVYAWQALFILLTLGVWLLWAAKASKGTSISPR